MMDAANRKTSTNNEPVMDEWEAKLLGKKNFVGKSNGPDYDAVSQNSQVSSEGGTNSLKRQAKRESGRRAVIPEVRRILYPTVLRVPIMCKFDSGRDYSSKYNIEWLNS